MEDVVGKARLALSGVESGNSEEQKTLALAEMRLRVGDAAQMIEKQDLVLQQRQEELKKLRHQYRLYTRQNECNTRKMRELENIVTSLVDNSGAGETGEKPRIIIPLLHEYNIEATEQNAEEKIKQEFEARKQAQIEVLLLQRTKDQLTAAEERLEDFLSTKWPRIRERYAEVHKLTTKVQTVYEEVMEEIDNARAGELQYDIKPQNNYSGRRGPRKRGRQNDSESSRKRRRT